MSNPEFTLHPGWEGKTHDGVLVLTKLNDMPRRILMETVKDGDVLPRETDQPLEGA